MPQGTGNTINDQNDSFQINGILPPNNLITNFNNVNNSSFAADTTLNQTAPLSDWVIERMKKSQPR